MQRSATPGSNPLRDKRDKRMPRIAGPCAVVIFGVTGDLATQEADARDLRPGQPRSAAADVRADRVRPARLGGRGLRARSSTRRCKEHARTPFRQEVWDRLAEGIRFVQGTFDDDEGLRAARRDTGEAGRRTRHRRQSRLLPVDSAEGASRRCCEQLSKSGLANKPEGDRWSRVVIEKPFGHDLRQRPRSSTTWSTASSPSTSVFRIDHYLGKETVQNILALRFANQLFDPIWNAHYVDHVQITMAEDIGLGGRGGYYDGVGAARDVIQNHLTAAAGADRDGGAGQLQARRAAGREDQGALGHPGWCEPLDENTVARPVHRGLAGRREGRRAARGGGLLQGLDHRDLRRHHAGGRHPPLGGRAVLPAHRKTAGPQGHRDRAGLQARSASAVRRDHDRGTRQERAGDPGAARRGHHHCGSAPRCPGTPWRSATSTWTSPTVRRSPRTPPRPTNA